MMLFASGSPWRHEPPSLGRLLAQGTVHELGRLRAVSPGVNRSRADAPPQGYLPSTSFQNSFTGLPLIDFSVLMERRTSASRSGLKSQSKGSQTALVAGQVAA